MGEQGFASDSKEIIEAHREVVFIMVRSEIARKVVQIFCLQRLADEDFWLAGSLLDMIVRFLLRDNIVFAHKNLDHNNEYAFRTVCRPPALIKLQLLPCLNLPLLRILWHAVFLPC